MIYQYLINLILFLYSIVILRLVKIVKHLLPAAYQILDSLLYSHSYDFNIFVSIECWPDRNKQMTQGTKVTNRCHYVDSAKFQIRAKKTGRLVMQKKLNQKTQIC